MEINTVRLRQFVVLAEELHFTRAAALLHVSQQGLSGSINDLEAKLGTPLFVRTTRSVVLTEAGEHYLQGARTALQILDAAAASARQSQQEVQGTLRLGLFVSSALELMGPILQLYEQRYPSVTVDMEVFDYRDPTGGLRSDHTDVAFVRTPIECPGLNTMPMFVEPRAVALNCRHRLADAELVTMSDLSTEAMVAAQTADTTWRRFWTLRDSGVSEAALPRVSRSAGSIEAELECVAAGVAVTITPLSFARYYPRSRVAYKRIADASGSEVALAWRGRGTRTARAFVEVAREVLTRERELVSHIETGALTSH